MCFFGAEYNNSIYSIHSIGLLSPEGHHIYFPVVSGQFGFHFQFTLLVTKITVKVGWLKEACLWEVGLEWNRRLLPFIRSSSNGFVIQ